jgi:hypothetical protein
MRTERQLLPIPYHVSKPYASHAFHEKTLMVIRLMADVMFILAGLESALSRLHDIFQYNRVSGSGSLKSDGRESASQ